MYRAAGRTEAPEAVSVYASHIGGSRAENGYSIAVVKDVNALVIGLTESDHANFLATSGPDLTDSGADDAFIAKLAPCAFFYLQLLRW